MAITMESVTRYQNLSATALATCLLVTGSAYAQELPDLNAVPDRTPFNYPSGTPISLEKAQALIQAGVAEAKKRGWPEEFAVVDWSGKLVAFARMDGAQLGSIAISEHKAARRPNFVGRRAHLKLVCRSMDSTISCRSTTSSLLRAASP